MSLGAVLYVYKGEWGLPSIDLECLRVLCLVKLTRCPITIETNSNPLRSGAGKLPYLRISNEKFVGYRKIKKLLDKEGYAIRTCALSDSFSNWVFTKLHVYLHYYLYGEPNNFEVTRALYAKRTPFPFNFYYPSSYQKEAQDIVAIMGNFDVDSKLEDHAGDYLTLNAKKCINVLSKRLGRNMWFFDNAFSEFDAFVYSYLAILYKINLPSNPLQIHIKACPNLVNFINRTSNDLFKREAFNTINTSKDNASPQDPMLTATERKFLESEKKTKLLAGIGAVLAMGTFAAVKVFYKKFSSNREYYDGMHYDDDDDDLEEDLE